MESKMKTLIIGVAGMAAVIFAGSTSASANSHLNCQAYAQSVIDQVNESTRFGCGFSGPIWSTDFNFHVNWCNQNTTQMHHLTEQQAIRNAALHQCKLTKPGSGVRPANAYDEQGCDSYARQMVANAQTNIVKGCNINDPRMHQNYQAHFDWCFNGRTKQQVKATLDQVIASVAKCGETKVFLDSGKYSIQVRKNLPVDVCNKGVPAGQEGLFNMCEQPVADLFCQQNGYQRAIKYSKANYNNGSNMDGDLPSTWWIGSNKACTGVCTGFSSITCAGRK